MALKVTIDLRARCVKLSNPDVELSFNGDDGRRFFYLLSIALTAKEMKALAASGDDMPFVAFSQMESRLWRLGATGAGRFKSSRTMATTLYQAWRTRMDPARSDRKYTPSRRLTDKEEYEVDRLFEVKKAGQDYFYRIAIPVDEIQIVHERVLHDALCDDDRSPSESRIEPELDDTAQLQTLDEVLGSDTVPAWFRRYGPVEVDFVNGRVYLPETTIDRLGAVVLGNPVALLEGAAGSGKSTLARALARSLAADRSLPVHFFHVQCHRHYNASLLAGLVNGVDGLVVLEDVHLEPDRFQAFRRQIRNDRRRYLLYTTLSSTCGTLLPTPAFERMPCVSLEPRDTMTSIIDLYSNAVPEARSASGMCARLMTTSKGDLWRLAYALKGLGAHGEEGQARGWLARSVIDELDELREVDAALPKVLLYLSSIYQDGTLVSRSFLTNKMSFSALTLAQLHRSGYISRHSDGDGNILYGLANRSVAALYWEFGKKYCDDRVPDQRTECLYQYAAACEVNSLEAIVRSETATRDQLVARLEKEERMPHIIRAERSAGAICAWLKARRLDEGDLELVDTLWTKVLSADLVSAGRCVREMHRRDDGPRYLRTPHQQDTGQLLCRLIWDDTVVDSAHFMADLLSVQPNLGHHLAELLLQSDYIERLNDTRRLDWVGESIAVLGQANKDIGRRLWCSLNIHRLADRLSRPEATDEALHCLYHILRADPTAYHELWSILDLGSLGEQISHYSRLPVFTEFMSALFASDREAGEGLWQRLDLAAIGARMCGMQDIESLRDCWRTLASAWPDALRHQLLSQLDLASLSGGLNHTPQIQAACETLATAAESGLKTVDVLIAQLSAESYASRLDRISDSETLDYCLSRLGQASAVFARAVCSNLDFQKLVGRVNTGMACGVPHGLAWTIEAYAPDRATALWRCVDTEQLAGALNAYDDAFNLAVLLHWIKQAAGDCVAAELAKRLDCTRLARQLSHPTDYGRARGTLRLLTDVSKDVAETVCRNLPLQLLADRFNEDSKGGGGYIAEVRKLWPEGASQLCDMLDPQRVADHFNRYLEPATGGLIGSIRLANATAGDKIIGLIKWRELASSINQTDLNDWEGMRTVLEIVRGICLISRGLAEQFCRRLDVNALAARLQPGNYEQFVELFFLLICAADEVAEAGFLTRIRKGRNPFRGAADRDALIRVYRERIASLRESGHYFPENA